MNESVLSLKNVTKTYGSSRGVTDISLDVLPGSVFGFLGPNGAGKTTTISMLADLIRPTSGTIEIFGQDSVRDSLPIRQRIGFLAGDFALDEGLTGQQQLAYFGYLRGDFPDAEVRRLAEHLDCDLGRKIKTLSRGNRQKIGLISALMHQPELLIFDEPTSGLDPLVQAEFNAIILEHKKKGKTVFVSSHVLSEVQEICDEVAFIREGQLVAVRSMADIAKGAPKLIQLRSTDSLLPKYLSKLKGMTITHKTHDTVEGQYLGDINALLDLLARVHVQDVSMQDADLEAAFMEYYKDQKDV